MISGELITSLQNACADLRTDEPLARHTTVRVGGPASIMALPKNDAELAAVLRIARETSPRPELAVIGGGANLFADSTGFHGLVVAMRGRQSAPSIDADGLLIADGGARLTDMAAEAARLGWGGIDFMAEVPGTVGGAVVINAGTNVGGYVADRFLWVETMDMAGTQRKRPAAEMEFAYRSSALLHGGELVLRAAFQLAPCAQLGQTPESLVSRFEAVMAERAAKFPLDFPNFGSTFRSPGAPHPPAGKLIDDLGMKETRVGDAQICDKHANFIVNLGSATSEDILGLMRKMHDAVLEHYDVDLRPEVHYLCDADRPRPDFFPARPTIL